jgi:glucose 1-dehydrogenase
LLESLKFIMSTPIDSRNPLKNQKALVTGASSGVGEASALALDAAGADVVVNAIASQEEAESVLDAIRKYRSNATTLKAEVTYARPFA